MYRFKKIYFLVTLLLLSGLSYLFLGSWWDLSVQYQYNQIVAAASKRDYQAVSSLSDILLEKLQVKVENRPNKKEYWLLVGDLMVLNGKMLRAQDIYRSSLEQFSDERFQQRLNFIQRFIEDSVEKSDIVAQVSVSIEPNLLRKMAKLDKNTPVFYIIKQSKISSRPLYVRKLLLHQIDKIVTITQQDTMLPDQSFEEGQNYILQVRIAWSGKVLPQKGDMEGSLSIKLPARQTIALEINHIIP